MCNSLNPDKHGVAQHCVPAVVYVAQDDWVASGKCLFYEWGEGGMAEIGVGKPELGTPLPSALENQGPSFHISRFSSFQLLEILLFLTNILCFSRPDDARYIFHTETVCSGNRFADSKLSNVRRKFA
jgi:hypothetical protein